MRDRIVEGFVPDYLEFIVPGFTLLLTTALLLGCWITLRECRHQGFSDEHRYQVVFLALLIALPGARLFYALQYPGHFSSIWDLASPNQGGLALYGGLLGVIILPSLYLLSQFTIPRTIDRSVPRCSDTCSGCRAFSRSSRMFHGRMQLGQDY